MLLSPNCIVASLCFPFQACNHYGPKHCSGLPFSHYVLRLHKLVLGSMGQVRLDHLCVSVSKSPSISHAPCIILQLDIWSPEKEMDSRGLRKPRPDKRHQRHRSSEEKARSRSRSRSRSKHRRSMHSPCYWPRSLRLSLTCFFSGRDRPHPLGRDQPLELQDGHSMNTLRSNLSGSSKLDQSLGVAGLLYSGPHSSPVAAYFVPDAASKEGSLPRQQGKDPKSAQQTYARVMERRRKLEALRKGLDMEDPSEMNSLYSEPTEFGDSKSMISANSFTRGESWGQKVVCHALSCFMLVCCVTGVFRPDYWHHSSQTALQMGADSTLSSDNGPLGDPSTWLQRQEQEIEAM